MSWSKVHTFTVCLLILAYVGTFPSGAQAQTFTESEKAWLSEHAQEVSFAPISDYPPFLWSQYGVLFGIASDYVNYIQEKLSISFKQQEPRTRAEIIQALKAGEPSFVAALAETPERDQYLLFTRPYISLPVIYVAKSGVKNKTSSEIIDGNLRVSVSNEYAIHSYLAERYPDMKLVPVDNDYLVLQNVLTGVTELGVVNVASLAHLVREYNMQNLKKIGDTGFDARLAMAVPKSMPELRNIFDNILETMPEKTKNAILSRWITDTATVENLAGSAAGMSETNLNNENLYLIIITALFMLCLGFILHYIFVRSTPRKNSTGKAEYVP